MEELEFALKEMKSNSAPGPDGFPTLFFKEFWDQSKEILMDMLNTLHRGGNLTYLGSTMELSR